MCYYYVGDNMYDLDGNEIKIVTDDEVEVNRMDDLDETMDLTEVIKEVNENE